MDDDKLLLCATLIEKFGLESEVDPHDITYIRTHKSVIYGLTNVYAFTHADHRYYASDDYSLENDARYVKNVFLEINSQLKGRLLTDPKDPSQLSVGIGNKQYYLWQAPLLK